MRKYWILIFIIALLLIVFGCAKQTPTVEKGEAIFGEFTAADMEGNPVTQEIFQDHDLTMINIWATFCGPCISEMPDLAQLQGEFGDDFQVIGIVVDATDGNGTPLPGKKAEAESIIEATGADYLHLLPSKSLLQNYLHNVQSVPETIFVDEDGCQVGERYLGARDKGQWTKIINDLLESVE